MKLHVPAAVLLATVSTTAAFAPLSVTAPAPCSRLGGAERVYELALRIPGSALSLAASAAMNPADDGGSSSVVSDEETALTKKQKRKEQIKSDGGFFAFDTKYGALNPYGILYGLTSIFLGIVWWVALTVCDIMHKITGGRVDRRRRVPITCSHIWGTLLLLLTGNMPKIENGDVIKNFHKTGETAMFVANHNSWMDIPFLGHTIGWKNYKFVAKKELEKVPILGKAIVAGGNVLVDRTNRRSQLVALKQGMRWLDDGVNLCTFPEGTRSRSNRLMDFKNGAFKMAHKAGKPVIPISIVRAAAVMPSYWMFPFRSSRGICKVVVHEPVESKGRTEAELAKDVRDAIISGLPEEQRPL